MIKILNQRISESFTLGKFEVTVSENTEVNAQVEVHKEMQPEKLVPMRIWYY